MELVNLNATSTLTLKEMFGSNKLKDRLISGRFKTARDLKINDNSTNWLSSRLCDLAEWGDSDFSNIAMEIMCTTRYA